MNGKAGFLSRLYAESFREHGIPRQLPKAGGWVLQRRIPGNEKLTDAMGCYPIFCCENWESLNQDISELRIGLVSLTLVTDPMANLSSGLLRKSFDLVRPYKMNFVTRGGLDPRSFVTKRHQQHAIRALRTSHVQLSNEPVQHLDEISRLYNYLVESRQIRGLKRLSERALEMQLSVPGLVLFLVRHSGKTIGFDSWYQQGRIAQGHLSAFDELGYKLRASYAVKWAVLEYFKDKVEWINLGAGKTIDGTDGLSLFKKGFATDTKPSWICGKIFDPRRYAALSGMKSECLIALSGYFPAYRAGELL